ncbi:MAG TPA: gamma-glutamyltransferase [Vicinamibacterales bacterium]|nr:gamma-glutamyltransferase [Vicinamibacterales bacterium]
MKRRDFVKSLGLAGVATPLTSSFAGAQQIGDVIRPDDPSFEGRAHRAVWGKNGVVASADEQASLAGIRIMMKGGNAIDAIVATAAALNVAEPYMSGMGGFGGYMMLYSAKEKKVLALDMMGLSPAGDRIDKMTEADFDEGYKSPVVPGNIGGWAEALRKYGTMSLGDVFEPAIELAEGNFVATHYDAQSFKASATKLAKYPTTAQIFMPDGAPPREGQVVRQPQLAASFRKIAKEGVDVFYKGEIAEKIAGFLQRNGGWMTEQDLAAWTPRWREPIATTFQGYTVYGMPPGSCEMTMFQILNVMEEIGFKGLDYFSTEFAHHWIETVKLAFVDDDRYNTGKDADIPVAKLISKAYAREQREKIRRDRPTARLLPRLGTEGTTSMAAADRFGNVVAFTQSLVSGFGCGVVAADTGILLNNGHRYGFVLDPKHVNALVPRQHPKGVMCPTIVMKGDKVLMGIGASGGYTIPQTVGQAIAKVLAYNMDVQQAIASPRVLLNRGQGAVPVGSDVQVYLDMGFPERVGTGLRALGHQLAKPGNSGAVQGVYVHPETGTLSGGSDPRRDGHAIAW